MEALLAILVIAWFWTSYKHAQSLRRVQTKLTRLEQRLASIEKGEAVAANADGVEQESFGSQAEQPPGVPGSDPLDELLGLERPKPPSVQDPLEAFEPTTSSPDSTALPQHPAPKSPRQRQAQTATRAPIDWERWLGLRGAALAGGLVLILSGLLFLQHAITQGWLGPRLRITVSTALGLALFTQRARILRLTSAHFADILTGAGAALLYGSAWAAWSLYHLIPFALAMPCMLAITVGICRMALRYESALLAFFAAAGGFGTPLLLQRDPWRAGPLFSYLLLLDAALLAIARRLGSQALGGVALVVTLLFQATWIFLRVPSGGVALAIIAPFALLFVVGATGTRRTQVRIALSAAGLLTFGVLSWVRLEVEMLHLATLLLLLQGLCYGVGSLSPRFPVVGSVASVALASIWTVQQRSDYIWPFSLYAFCALGLAGFYAFFALDDPRRRFLDRPAFVFAATALPALSLVTLSLHLDPEHSSYWAGGWLASLALAGNRLLTPPPKQLRKPPFTQPALALLAGFAFGAPAANVAVASSHTTAPPLLALLLATAVAAALQFDLVKRAAQRVERSSPAFFCLAVAVCLPERLDLAWFGLPLLALAAHVSLRTGWPALFAGTIAVGAVLQRRVALGPEPVWLAVTLTLLLIVSVAAPVLAQPRRTWHGRAWFGFLALAAVPSGLSFELFHTLRNVRPHSAAEILLALLAASAGVLAAVMDATSPAVKPTREREGYGWSLASTWTFLIFALAHGIGPSWGAVAGCLCGAVGIHLSGRYPSVSLRIAGAAVVGFSASLQALRTLTPNSFPSEAWWLAPWLTYGLLVPAGAALWSSRVLAPERLPFLRVLSGVLASLSLGLLFLWLNLLVLNFFGESATIGYDWQRHYGRDLTQSLVWGAFALGLLLIGSRSAGPALRWASLILAMLTAAKVFLYDLSELRGLFRVASTAGLALALLSISFIYHRLIFRGSSTQAESLP